MAYKQPPVGSTWVSRYDRCSECVIVGPDPNDSSRVVVWQSFASDMPEYQSMHLSILHATFERQVKVVTRWIILSGSKYVHSNILYETEDEALSAIKRSGLHAIPIEIEEEC